jgi:hypothetical protein
MAVTVTVVAFLAAAADPLRKPAVTAAELKDAPLTISASTVGRFARGHSWHLKVNPAGRAELSIETFPDRTVKQFQVSKEQLSEFRSALAEERFFELNGDYGEQVVDGSEKSLTVAAGNHTNTVKVHFLMNWAHSDKAKLREPSRAVRLLVLVRGWFDAADAVDLRKYDKIVLDAAKE